eukprot:CAMPEP_0175705912 /NCGR_PEP_ID=MMETSP0097-20121207/37778_1 /TAXON_ID=311494 /ORGANISM="Alexandrium monilatum, Strain CCMP3105" /LENGTH=46 /DNA_ID= /DNA_START= /DNA_END= /DNA_ORIENTATION=
MGNMSPVQKAGRVCEDPLPPPPVLGDLLGIKIKDRQDAWGSLEVGV